MSALGTRRRLHCGTCKHLRATFPVNCTVLITTQKQPNCKKRRGPCKKQHEKVVKSKVAAQEWLWWSNNGKNFNNNNSGKFVSLIHKFTWVNVIKNFVIIRPPQPLLGRHLWFPNFFHAAFFAWVTSSEMCIFANHSSSSVVPWFYKSLPLFSFELHFFLHCHIL